MSANRSRREFLKLMSYATGGLIMAGCSPLVGALHRPASAKAPTPGHMPLRQFGSTGNQVSLLGLGGEAAIESTNQELAAQIINEAIDHGVNYLDTSWWYPGGNNGQRERNIGQVMVTRRDEVFLATKSHGRSYSAVMGHIKDSLSRLNTDRIDLYQLHDVRTQNDLDSIFHPSNGALKAMERLLEEGVIRSIGITGHYDREILLQAVNRYPFDSILLSLNAADVWHEPFQEELLKTAINKNMGIVAMKVAGKGRLLGSDKLTMKQAMEYVYSFPVSCAIVGIHTLAELYEDIEITNSFAGPLSDAELAQLENATQSYQSDGNWPKK